MTRQRKCTDVEVLILLRTVAEGEGTLVRHGGWTVTVGCAVVVYVLLGGWHEFGQNL